MLEGFEMGWNVPTVGFGFAVLFLVWKVVDYLVTKCVMGKWSHGMLWVQSKRGVIHVDVAGWPPQVPLRRLGGLLTAFSMDSSHIDRVASGQDHARYLVRFE